MMHRDNKTLLNEILKTNTTCTDASEKETYEAPTLTIVKFMFENDITWGSATNNPGGSDGGNDGGVWWG